MAAARYVHNPAFILGYHGCDGSTAESVLSGDNHLVSSTNSYDWLGHGIYFWEGDPDRALSWARQRMRRPESAIKHPTVIGAIIDPGACLSFLQSSHIRLLETAYNFLKQAKDQEDESMPENAGGDDLFLRRLDCAVIQTLHASREEANLSPFDSVRGLFREGAEPYPQAGFRRGNHIQVCVRNIRCIKGYFRPV